MLPRRNDACIVMLSAWMCRKVGKIFCLSTDIELSVYWTAKKICLILEKRPRYVKKYQRYVKKYQLYIKDLKVNFEFWTNLGRALKGCPTACDIFVEGALLFKTVTKTVNQTSQLWTVHFPIPDCSINSLSD